MMGKDSLDFLHAFALLKKYQVYVMLYLFEFGNGGYTDIAEKYNVTAGNVYNATKPLVENGLLLYTNKKFCLSKEWRENLIKWKLTTTTECD